VTLPAIILAAGASRRLGQPKQIVRIGNETLLERTIRVALESGCEPLIVVLGSSAERIVETVNLRNVRVIFNSDWERGIASSIVAGVAGCQELIPGLSGLMLLVCDLPKLGARHLRRLKEEFNGANQTAIVASSYEGITGIPAIFPVSQFPNLLALKGDTGARQLMKNPACALISVPFPEGKVDVDTPEDLAAL